MFERIMNFVREAINKMFKTNDIAKTFNIDITTNDEVTQLIQDCTNIYNGKAPWLNNEVKSLKVANAICNKVAKAVTIEFKTKCEDESIDKVYQRFLRNIRTNTEYAIAKGGMFFKPYYSNGTIKVSCVHADKFIPTRYDDSGEILGAIFIDQITKGDNIFSRLEYQSLDNNTITIKNVAYKGTKSNPMSNKISLELVEEWAQIQEEATISNVSKLIGGYFRIPISNTIDNSSQVGVPLFTNAIGTLEEIDKQFSRILWEYEGSELAIDIDATAFQKDKNGRDIIPSGKKRLYRKVDFGDETTWNVFSPAIRDNPLFNGLNELLRQVESECGISFGIISKNNEIAKTATEIESSKQDYYVTVSDIQGALQSALEDLIEGIDVLMTLYKIPHKINPDISFDWDDSIIVNSKEKQTQALVERNAGLIDDIEYFKITRDYSEDEAIEYVQSMRKRNSENLIKEADDEE